MATLRGTRNNDRLRGEDDDDEIFGLAGDDRLAGGRGNDRIFGGAGDDRIFGQAGADVLAGSDPLFKCGISASRDGALLWGDAQRYRFSTTHEANCRELAAGFKASGGE